MLYCLLQRAGQSQADLRRDEAWGCPWAGWAPLGTESRPQPADFPAEQEPLTGLAGRNGRTADATNPSSGRPTEVGNGVSKTDSVTGSPCPAWLAQLAPAVLLPRLLRQRGALPSTERRTPRRLPDIHDGHLAHGWRFLVIFTVADSKIEIWILDCNLR